MSFFAVSDGRWPPPVPKFAKDFGFIPGKSGAFPIRFDRNIDLRLGAVTYVARYSDFDDYAQACIEGRA